MFLSSAQIPMKFVMDIHDGLRIIFDDFDNPLTFHLKPLLAQNVQIYYFLFEIYCKNIWFWRDNS